MDLDPSFYSRIGIIKSQLENVDHFKQLLDFENEIKMMFSNTMNVPLQTPSSKFGNSSSTTVKRPSSSVNNSWMKAKITSNDQPKTNQEVVEDKAKFFISVYFNFNFV